MAYKTYTPNIFNFEDFIAINGGDNLNDPMTSKGKTDTSLFAPSDGVLYMDMMGNNSDNSITGTSRNDLLEGLGGDDFLYGLGGRDHLYGGDGNDFLDGGSGNDRLDGGAGADIMIGGQGSDLYFVDHVSDQVVEISGVGSGYDTVMTTLDLYFLGSDSNIERVNYQGDGNFMGRGNAGDNRFHGFNGDDRFLIDEGGADIFSGGNGRDTFDARSSTNGIILHLEDQSLNGGDVEGDFFASIENFFGSMTAGDYMQSNGGQARFAGYGGDDTLIGGDSVDILQGGADNDTIMGNGGSDLIYGGVGNDTMTGGDADDIYLFMEKDFGADVITDYEPGSDNLKIHVSVATSLLDFTITGLGTTEVSLTLNDGTGNNIITLQTDGELITLSVLDFIFFGVSANAELKETSNVVAEDYTDAISKDNAIDDGAVSEAELDEFTDLSAPLDSEFHDSYLPAEIFADTFVDYDVSVNDIWDIG